MKSVNNKQKYMCIIFCVYHITILTQPTHSFAACLASGRLCVLTKSPRQPTLRDLLSMVRYTTGTATEIQPQQDSNPLLSSTSQHVADMRLSGH